MLGATISQLPPSEYADTEVATNIPFAVSLPMMSRLEFTLTLDTSPTNVVEVLAGADEDGGGRLSMTESAWAFGYNCGRLFTRNAEEDRITDELTPQTGRIRRMFLLRKSRLDVDWNLVKVVRSGVRLIGEVAIAEGTKPGFVPEIG